MASFRNSKDKASHVLRDKVCHGSARHGRQADGQIHSLGTERNYKQALKGFQDWLSEGRLGDLKTTSQEVALKYLQERSTIVTQKTLDLDRQAIQVLLGEKLGRVKATVTKGRLGRSSRAYTPEQVKSIAAQQSERYSLATELAHAAGLRAHELLTLRLAGERPASSHREWSNNRFEGRDGVVYTVVGKGGLITEKLIPQELSNRLEARKLDVPQGVRDRGINYERFYDVVGGKKWSENFSSTSKEVLGFSFGGHGLRHSYVQVREVELQVRGFTLDEARGIVSQEVSHFSPETTKAYER